LILNGPDGLVDDTGMAEPVKEARQEASTRQARQAKTLPDEPEKPAPAARKKAG